MYINCTVYLFLFFVYEMVVQQAKRCFGARPYDKVVSSAAEAVKDIHDNATL